MSPSRRGSRAEDGRDRRRRRARRQAATRERHLHGRCARLGIFKAGRLDEARSRDRAGAANGYPGRGIRPGMPTPSGTAVKSEPIGQSTDDPGRKPCTPSPQDCVPDGDDAAAAIRVSGQPTALTYVQITINRDRTMRVTFVTLGGALASRNSRRCQGLSRSHSCSEPHAWNWAETPKIHVGFALRGNENG